MLIVKYFKLHISLNGELGYLEREPECLPVLVIFLDIYCRLFYNLKSKNKGHEVAKKFLIEIIFFSLQIKYNML